MTAICKRRSVLASTEEVALSNARMAWLEQQKKSLWLHGFLENDFDFSDWVDPRPLAAAHELLKSWRDSSKL